MIHLSIGITGHRDLREQDVADIESSVKKLFRELQGRFPDLPLQLVTALAEGSDQLAARVALSMDIPVIAVLPMDQAEYEKDFSSSSALMTFRSLLKQAQQIITMPPVSPQQGVPIRDGEHARQLQYAQVGVFISNHCQLLLALWDGKEGELLGGTGQVVKYHLTAVMDDGFEWDPTPASLLAENENDLVYHVVCARDRENGEPADGYEPGETFWFCSRSADRRLERMPRAYGAMFERLQQFVQDRYRHEGSINENRNNLLESLPGLDVPASVRLTDRLFQVADSLAIHFQRRVNMSLKVTYGLAVAMGLAFLLYSESSGDRLLVMLFLLLFFSGVALNQLAQRRQWHRKYLDYRALAEGLRVQLYWNLAGVVDAGTVDFAYDSFLQKQDIDLGWIRHVMRTASLHRERGKPADEGWVDWVVDRWVGDPQASHGQVAYYSRKHHQNLARFRRAQWLGNLSLWTGIAVAMLLAFLSGDRLEQNRQLLLILMGVLPLVAGVWDAYSYKKADRELIKQYQFMNSVFSRAGDLLAQTRDVRFQRRVLQALGQAALDEGAEWLLIHRERPPEHGGL